MDELTRWVLNDATRLVAGVHSGGGLGLDQMVERFLTAVSDVGLAGLGELLLPGTAAMSNVHPLLVHFPIALLTSFLAVELLALMVRNASLRTVASWLLYLGTLGALATVAAGWVAAQSIPHGEAVHQIMETHEALGFGVLGFAVVLSLWRLVAGAPGSQMGRALHLLLAFVMVGLMVFGADLGGLMVYKYGVAVEAAPQPQDDHIHQGVDPRVPPHSHGGHSHSH